jgi:hypothetical protein
MYDAGNIIALLKQKSTQGVDNDRARTLTMRRFSWLALSLRLFTGVIGC